jgi:hypothetical protein
MFVIVFRTVGDVGTGTVLPVPIQSTAQISRDSNFGGQYSETTSSCRSRERSPYVPHGGTGKPGTVWKGSASENVFMLPRYDAQRSAQMAWGTSQRGRRLAP